MLITLFTIFSMMYLLRYYSWSKVIVLVISQEPWVYAALAILCLVLWLVLLIKRQLPVIRSLYLALSRVSSKLDNLANQLGRSQSSDSGPFKNGQKRSYSKTTTQNPLSNNKRGNFGSGRSLSKVLSSRRIKGLFATILENGAMVSLEPKYTLWHRIKNEGKLKDSPKLLEKEALRYAASAQSEGLLVKTKRNKDGGFSILTQKSSSVSDLIMGLGWRMISACFPNKVNFTSRLRLLSRYSTWIFRVYKTNGAEQVVKLLKASQLALQKAIAHDKVDNLRQLDKTIVRSKLSKSGIPTIIPLRDRKLILGQGGINGSDSILRFWLTLFSIYRVINIPGTLKLHTIIAPALITPETSKVARQFTSFLRLSSAASMFRRSVAMKPAELLFLESASATHKVAWGGLLSDVQILVALKLDGYARNILHLLGQYEMVLLFDILRECAPRVEVNPHLNDFSRGEDKFSDSIIASPEHSFAGKLSIKEEAAGKLRVFAMVDIWTQMVLKPIEQMLAVFLKGLPNDGVYNQHNSEMRARQKSLNAGRSFGYDLSAATDRLPIGIQKEILNLIVPNLGDNWGLLLTKRDYFMYLPHSFASEIGATDKTVRAKYPNAIDIGSQELPIYYNEKGQPWVLLRYATGQPMGALSSFAMLAVTHHLLTQFAYRIAYGVPMNLRFTKDTWYTNYECTGDDIIIFDALVAAEYLKIMDALGVPINTTKSVVANVPATEYLKVTSRNGRNVGAVSWRMFMSGNSLMGRVNIIYSMLSKGIITKNIMRWIERIARLGPYNANSNLTPTLVALWTMLSNRDIIPVEESLKALISGKEKVFRFARAILLNADVDKISKALPKIFSEGVVNISTPKAAEVVWSFEQPWFKISFWKPLAVFQAKQDIAADTQALSEAIWNHIMYDLPGWSSSLTIDQLKDCKNEAVDPRGIFDTEVYPSEQVIHPFGNPTIIPELASEEGLMYNTFVTLFQCLKGHIGRKLERIGTPVKERALHPESPLPLLVEDNRLIERYAELLQLVVRAENKLDEDFESPPPRIIKPSELKLIQLLRKMGNRPLFTTAASLW